jgi:hypothetical protein
LQERLKDWEQKEAQARAEVAALKSSVAAAAKREQEQRNMILDLKKDQQAREGKEREYGAPALLSGISRQYSLSPLTLGQVHAGNRCVQEGKR